MVTVNELRLKKNFIVVRSGLSQVSVVSFFIDSSLEGGELFRPLRLLATSVYSHVLKNYFPINFSVCRQFQAPVLALARRD